MRKTKNIPKKARTKKTQNTKKTQKTNKKPKTKEQFVKAKCGPGKSNNDFTCYDEEALHKMKTLWNARHPDAKIEQDNGREIWNKLKDNMAHVCNTEKCWLRQNFSKHKLSKDLLLYTFAPNAPESWKTNPNEWLSSVDIEKVMKQYEDKHSDFVFLGPSPIDFDKQQRNGECVWKELCEFNLEEQLANNKTKFGFIFNTDPHYSSGSHWISMFLDMNKNTLFFFDSTGDRPPREVSALIRRIMSQGKASGVTLRKIINDKVHQNSNTECGMYCLHMIISMLENKHTPSYFMSKRVSDSEMEDLRRIYFNEHGV